MIPQQQQQQTTTPITTAPVSDPSPIWGILPSRKSPEEEQWPDLMGEQTQKVLNEDDEEEQKKQLLRKMEEEER